MKRGLIIVFITSLLIISSCKISEPESKSLQDKCIDLCKTSTLDLNNGPCLSDNNRNWNVDDWVCDVAHNPRQDIDNLPENQCQDYRDDKASHFVEVTPNCEFIKAI